MNEDFWKHYRDFFKPETTNERRRNLTVLLTIHMAGQAENLYNLIHPDIPGSSILGYLCLADGNVFTKNTPEECLSYRIIEGDVCFFRSSNGVSSVCVGGHYPGTNFPEDLLFLERNREVVENMIPIFNLDNLTKLHRARVEGVQKMMLGLRQLPD